jgi:hypothetical protein
MGRKKRESKLHRPVTGTATKSFTEAFIAKGMTYHGYRTIDYAQAALSLCANTVHNQSNNKGPGSVDLFAKFHFVGIRQTGIITSGTYCIGKNLRLIQRYVQDVRN